MRELIQLTNNIYIFISLIIFLIFVIWQNKDIKRRFKEKSIFYHCIVDDLYFELEGENMPEDIKPFSL